MSRDVPVAGDRLPDSIRMLAPGAVTGMIDSTAVVDSILSQADSVPVRKSRIRRDKVDLDAQVVFSSKDSMVLVGGRTTYMYGEASVDYG